MRTWLEPWWPAMCGALDAESSPGLHQRMSSWKGVSICFVEGEASGLPCPLPGTFWDSGGTTETLLNSPKVGTSLSSPLSSLFLASPCGRSPGQLFIEGFPPTLLESSRRVSVRNPCRDLRPGSLKIFRSSSISKWVWPLKYLWKSGTSSALSAAFCKGRA